ARTAAGTLSVTRHTTGAIVRRQPFGGWKASSVGPGAKAGGPNYVLQLARWAQRTLAAPDAGLPPRGPGPSPLSASAADYARTWRAHFAVGHAPSGVIGEDNVFRYRPARGVA